MSVGTATQLRLFVFGELDGEPWGVAATSELGSVATFADAASAHGDTPEEPWWLVADGVELEFEPTSASKELGGDGEGVVQLARVKGRLGAEEVDCFGIRGVGEMIYRPFESIRVAAGWLAGADGFALCALRPEGAAGQDADAVSAAVFEAGEALPIAEPRLSTVYGHDGVPVRAGLELWLQEPDELEDEDGSPRQFPRRAAGEALGAAALLEVGPLELRAEQFRWHLRGEDAAGVYLLARRR